MSKFQKSNKEAKKAKKQSDGTNKQKNDSNRRDGFVTRISKEFNS